VQSLLAIGSGGTTGSGYGLSQQKLFYLPFPDTDFIFAVFGEEFGFIGGILLLIMLFLYATLALIVAVKCRHRIRKFSGDRGNGNFNRSISVKYGCSHRFFTHYWLTFPSL
jgi:cell division protein FtsW (lipid II flippase)